MRHFFFPHPCFLAFSLCSDKGPCSSLWFSWLKRADVQPHWQHNMLFPCFCWHSLQNSGSATREGLNALLLVTMYSPASLPPMQEPKPLKDLFLGFVFNVNSEASLCVQCEIIPALESDNPGFFLYIKLMYPFCSLMPCFSPFLIKHVLGVVIVGHHSWQSTQHRMKMALLSPAVLYGFYVLARWYNKDINSLKLL